MQKVADGIEADIPDAMVDAQAEQMVNNFKQQMAAQGIPFEQYLKMTNTSEADFKAQAQAPALGQVRMDLALAAIVKEEKLEASDAEVDAEMEKVAQQYGMDLETVKKYLRADEVKEQVLREKAIRVVADSAKAVAPEAAEEEKGTKKTAKKAEDGEEKPAKKPAAKKTAKKAEDKAE